MTTKLSAAVRAAALTATIGCSGPPPAPSPPATTFQRLPPTPPPVFQPPAPTARPSPAPPRSAIVGSSDQPDELLEFAVNSGPLAARAARCGYWDGYAWTVRIAKAESRRGTEGSTEAFIHSYNAGLTDSSDPMFTTPCGLVRELALETLLMWDRMGR